MDAELYQEKMDPTHRMYLCRMLGMKELPECLLEQYARVKRMVDRIDGHLSPGDLAMIIMSAPIDMIAETVEQPAEQPLDESDDRAIEQAVEQTAEQMVDEAVKETLEQTADKPVGKDILWSLGMPVNVLAEDELKQGKIVGIMSPAEGSGEQIQLTVEFEDGEIETVKEDEVEAD